MTKFDILVQEQLLLIDESWKNSLKKYATGAAIGAAGLLGLQHGLKDKHHNYDVTRTQIQQHQSSGGFRAPSTTSNASAKNPIKSKKNINDYKFGLMTKFNDGTNKFTIVKEKGEFDGEPTGFQFIRIYDTEGRKIVAIRFTKDGSHINGITKYGNKNLPEKLKQYMKSNFSVDL